MTRFWTSQGKVGVGEVRHGPRGSRESHGLRRFGVKFMGSPYHLKATESLSDLPKSAQLVSGRGLVCDTDQGL